MKGVVPQWVRNGPFIECTGMRGSGSSKDSFAGRALGLFFLLCGIPVKVADRLSVVLTFLSVFRKTQSSTLERQMKCQCFLALPVFRPGMGYSPFSVKPFR